MNKLLGVAILAWTATSTLVLAEPEQDVYFDKPQYIFACSSLDDLELVIDAFARSPQIARDMRDALRVPPAPGAAPPCDYLGKSGEYALFSDLGGVTRLYLDESFGDGLMNDYVNVYRITSAANVQLHMLLYFEPGGEQLQEGYDILTRVLGVE